MEQPDTITIETLEKADVFADSVDLYTKIKGKSFFNGDEAFKKAREVRDLVEELTSFGILEGDILLESVHAHASKGIIGKSSSATY